MKVKKGDFIELEFTGKSEDNKVFDTNVEEIAKNNNMYNEEDKDKFKPLKICIGENMVVKGFDKELEGKDIEKEYKITLEPDDAFGIRNKQLIKTVSINSFRQQGFEPVAGMVVSLDNMLARIAAVSGGRVIIDLNNPLAGKKVSYEFKILKQISDEKEKLELIVTNLLGLSSEIKIDAEKKKAKIILEYKIPVEVQKQVSGKIKEILDIESEFLVKDASLAEKSKSFSEPRKDKLFEEKKRKQETEEKHEEKKEVKKEEKS